MERAQGARAMKLIVNQAYENMGLASTQTLGPILDGLMRNTPDAKRFIGTWRLVSDVSTGLMYYDSLGNMAAQVMPNRVRRALPLRFMVFTLSTFTLKMLSCATRPRSIAWTSTTTPASATSSTRTCRPTA